MSVQRQQRYGYDAHTSGDCHDGNTLATASHGHDGHIFDAAAWFAAWSDNGGAAMLIGDRLWIGTGSAVSREAAQALASLRAHLHTRDARDALAGLLRANAGGMR